MIDIDLIRASNGIAEPVRATVQAVRNVNSTTLVVDSVLGFPQKFIATAGELTPEETLDPATVQVFVGHLSGNQIEIDEFAPGYPDVGNSVGHVVVIKPTTLWADTVADVVERYHGNDIIIKVSEDQPDPDPDGGTILWIEPL